MGGGVKYVKVIVCMCIEISMCLCAAYCFFSVDASGMAMLVVTGMRG